MCWACYTPLSGSAPLGAGLAAGATATLPKTGGPAVGVPQVDAPAKKGIDPKTIAIGAVLLVGVVAAVMMSGMMGGGGGGDTIVAGVDPGVQLEDPGFAAQPPPAAAPPPLLGSPGGGGAPPAPVPVPFTTIVPPNSKFKTGTLGILMTQNSSPAGAAKFAKNQFAKNGNWTNMQVAVFTDKTAAAAFSQYQSRSQSAPLTNADFQALADAGVWSGAAAFLDARGKSEKVYSPSRNPLSWWPGR